MISEQRKSRSFKLSAEVRAKRREHNRRYVAAHKEQQLKWQRECYARRTEEQRQQDLERRRLNQKKHIERLSSDKNQDRIGKMRAYYANNKAMFAKRSKEWRRKNPDRVSYHRAKRRALLQAEADINFDAMKAFVVGVKSKLYAKCYYCGKRTLSSKIHLDHIIPLAKGGQHRVENLCVSCAPCNLSKHDKYLRTWIRMGQQILEL